MTLLIVLEETLGLSSSSYVNCSFSGWSGSCEIDSVQMVGEETRDCLFSGNVGSCSVPEMLLTSNEALSSSLQRVGAESRDASGFLCGLTSQEELETGREGGIIEVNAVSSPTAT